MPDSPHNPNWQDATQAAPPTSVRIVTGSRLHFGLLDTHPPFGGVGVMIHSPVTEVVVTPWEAFICDSSDSPRVLEIAKRIAASQSCGALPACRLDIVRRPPAHCGLGTGTQLSLAVAEAITMMLGWRSDPQMITCQYAGRGQRSAVGSHGYFRGGLIYEEAQAAETLNPIQLRLSLPEEWRVAIFRPAGTQETISGRTEAEQFAKLPPVSSARGETLRRMITESIIPAAQASDFEHFSQAVSRYNHASGELFAEVQGGPYHGPQVAALVRWLLDRGITGVGQSSWGPGVFAWFKSQQDWESFQPQLPTGVNVVSVTQVRNQGRTIELT